VITSAVLRILSGASIPDGSFLQYSYGVPQLVTAAVTTTQHNLYGASGVFNVPEGVSVLRAAVTYVTPPENASTFAAMVDGNPNTYTEMTLSNANTNGVFLTAGNTSRVVGYEIDYSLTMADGARADSFGAGLNIPGTVSDVIFVPSNDKRTLRVLTPPSGADPLISWQALLSVGKRVGYANPPAASLKIYEVRLLAVDEDAAQRVAASYLQAPYSTPAELTLPTLIAPTPQLTVTGSPDGDVTGDTAQWEYEHSPANVRTTRVKLGANGVSDTARAIKFLAQAEAKALLR